jgi:single-stranded-DNA-specific exonuclease
MRWTYLPPPAGEVAALVQRLGVNPILAELLLRQRLDDVAAGQFLRSGLSALADPFLLRNLEAAATRLRQAIAGREDVVVLGDYDVDGVSSTALLVSGLRRFGLQPRFVVPRRSEDGYGLSRSAIDRALETGRPQLFIALDCGTNSIAEVDYLLGLGVEVIVIDHHRSKEEVMSRGLLINPHVMADESGADADWRHLCTVGLVFKLMHGLLKQLRVDNHPTAFEYKLANQLDLVAMGIIADLVPLQGENRIMARHGLRMLEEARRPGVRALMEVAGVRRGQPIMPVDISFRLGPRINASGRLADAALSVELLLSEDEQFCVETARQLDLFNRERQDIERQITSEAERQLEEHFVDDQGVVLFSENWHPGVVGIVAGRVTRKYNRPCVVLGNEGDMAKGSGRSVEGINLVEVLGACSTTLSSWGGHPMAVGVALEKVNLAAFRQKFATAVRTHAGDVIAEAELAIAAWLPAADIHEGLMDELEGLHPFGQGNPEPVFGVRGVVFRQRPLVFKDHHFRFAFDTGTGRQLHGVAWKMADRLPPVGEALDLAVQLRWNHFNGRKLLQLELVDWRLTG